jgi:hypothetical protein
LTLWPVKPAAFSMLADRSIAQPLTKPDGSNRPAGQSVK